MNIFIVGTGRCGTVTMSKACKHISNFTSNHETHKGATDFIYPDNHIEIDGALCHFIPTIKEKYPDAKWIHLWRDPEPTIVSLSKRPSLQFYSRFHFRVDKQNQRKLAEMYYYNTIGLVDSMLPDALKVNLSDIKTGGWKKVWDYIGAEGNYDTALLEFNKKYNKSK